ncbi:hypothetical protein BYT27DRAFT_7249672 [Phlegmacium glaucopus]|nr:hypothetical protein BYT27DRAFT_7249672 [Phlegmacium glaucopus]
MCWACMRQSHRENPLHRIEQWNGSYFRNAELWEVGTYLLVRHHEGEAECKTLRVWCKFLERTEQIKDDAEQEHLRRSGHTPVPVPVPGAFCEEGEIDMEEQRDRSEGEDDDKDEIEIDEDEELEDTEILHPYLEATADYNAGAGAGPCTAMPGMYVRVVHSNGLHHIAMISCQCRGDNVLPLDLFGAQLLPASFKRIKTLFTAQVLDMYHLSNLELKASAYQFYQLLCRLTRPMAPAEVINLYREFWRMSRIWCWMKKLKWARYASNKKVNEVEAGELVIYCPACLQPGINLLEKWKDNPARHIKQSLPQTSCN